jgi:aminocarboxymuconate-semialdehyde decarboxylase
MLVVDVHTHMLGRKWAEMLREKGPPHYEFVKRDGRDYLLCDGAPFLTPQPAHFDYELRLKDMDAARVDLSIVSLTAPNCFFGDEATSLAAAKLVNDEMAAAQRAWPDRIRWMCSIPWEYADAAIAELRRAHANGAVGVMCLANINGRSLTEPAFAPVWKAIDDLALPVLIHPTSPPGTKLLDLQVHNMTGSVGFMFDTSLAVGRMIYDGFFETHQKLKIIAAHAGGALPYIIGRLDRCFEMEAQRRTKISRFPSEYMRSIYYDAVCYRQSALQMCLEIGGPDNLMYGSDYPHGIGDMKGCLARVDSLSAQFVKGVRGTNAQRIFGL